LETLRHGGQGALPEVGGIIFFNPNIHPLLEFRRRVKALRLYLERDPLQAEIDGNYGLPAYLAAVLNADGTIPERRERCRRCYLFRLGRAAELAATQGYEAFSSTLLASREQDRDLVAEAGREAGEARKLRFVVADLRQFSAPDKLLRGIYKQQYCGCVFSEEERYRNTNKHVYRPGGSGTDDEAM
jgi:predicted adenine nucleotide alpha hydrolase (AANH) superfamily ATPase